MPVDVDDALGEPYSFGECHSKVCYVKASCKAWETPEHEIKVHIRRSGDFDEILLPELIYLTNKNYTQKDIITIDLNLLDDELDTFLGKTRVGRQFIGIGLDNRNYDTDKNSSYDCTIILTKDGKIYISPSDDCFGFSSISTGLLAGSFSTVLSFIPDDSEPEIPSEPETKKAAT